MTPANNLTRSLIAIVLGAVTMHAEARPAQLDDSPVPPYELPNPQVTIGGAAVSNANGWNTQRRGELLEQFAREVYGRTPGSAPAAVHAEVTAVDRASLGGAATRKEVTIWFAAKKDGPGLHLLLYVPNARKAGEKVPVFLGLNFYGNHTVDPDQGITLSSAWMMRGGPGVMDHRATEKSRGGDVGKWPIAEIIARGYAVATAYCGDLCPDRPEGLAEGVNGWLTQTTTESRAKDAWGAIGVWAWGLSRALDYLETDADVDATRVAVHGHSRLGKAALWAGAQDERFAMVISNESGCGGAALSKRIHGETVAKINARFPHWFARNFRHYDANEAALPVDQHQLLALVAPRPLYVASAEGDDWADPRGEFLAMKAAAPVYRLFGVEGPVEDDVPFVHTPVGGALRYHIRTGQHGMTAYDWSCYLDFADRWLREGKDRG